MRIHYCDQCGVEPAVRRLDFNDEPLLPDGDEFDPDRWITRYRYFCEPCTYGFWPEPKPGETEQEMIEKYRDCDPALEGAT